MNREQVASLRDFMLKRDELPGVLKELCDISGKTMDDLLPTEDELYSATHHTDAADFRNLAGIFAKLFLTKVFVVAGTSQCEAEQIASQALMENSGIIDYFAQKL